MPAPTRAKMLRLHISEHDKYRGRPLYEAVIDKCRELHIAGATVYRGLEGYGETAEVHRARLITHDLPVNVSIIDTAENIARLLPFVEEMMDTGLIAMNDVEVIRIKRSEPQGD